MLYNHEKDLTSTEERIKSSDISETNKQLIFEFESNCFAEGLKISRTLKHLTELKVFTHMLGKEFKDTSKLDIMKVVERLERTDRLIGPRRTTRSIRKFYRWFGKNDVVDRMKISSRKVSRLDSKIFIF